jgi:hypothetical protein
MRYIIYPFKGVNNWYFGMKRDEVRRLINATPHELLGLDLNDIYLEIGLHFFYNYGEPFIFHAIMATEPNSIYFNDKNLLGDESIRDLGNWFQERYEAVNITNDGVVICSLGIYLSTQDLELFGDDPPESVGVFSKDSSHGSVAGC